MIDRECVARVENGTAFDVHLMASRHSSGCCFYHGMRDTSGNAKPTKLTETMVACTSAREDDEQVERLVSSMLIFALCLDANSSRRQQRRALPKQMLPLGSICIANGREGLEKDEGPVRNPSWFGEAPILEKVATAVSNLQALEHTATSSQGRIHY
jgi:hypothetical protein